MAQWFSCLHRYLLVAVRSLFFHFFKQSQYFTLNYFNDGLITGFERSCGYIGLPHFRSSFFLNLLTNINVFFSFVNKLNNLTYSPIDSVLNFTDVSIHFLLIFHNPSLTPAFFLRFMLIQWWYLLLKFCHPCRK